MFKKTQKKMSLVLVIAMIFTMLFSTVAFAANEVTGVVVGNVPTIFQDGSIRLASIRFGESSTNIGSLEEGTEIEVTLPTDVLFQDVDTDVTEAVYDYFAASNISVESAIVNADGDVLTITLGARDSLLTTAALLIKLPVDVTDAPASGNLTVSVTTDSSAIAEGDFVVGKFGEVELSAKISGTTVPTLSLYDGIQTVSRKITIKGNTTNAIATGADDEIDLVLPVGFSWSTATVTGATTKYSGRTLTLKPTATTEVTIENPQIYVSRTAGLGEIEVLIDGFGDNNFSATLVLAKLADYGVSVKLVDEDKAPIKVNAGSQKVLSPFKITETATGSLIPGGTVSLTLPKGVTWLTAAENLDAGRLTLKKVTDSGRTLVYDVAYKATKAAVTFTPNVSVAPTFSGDIDVTVSGTAGLEGEVTIGVASKLVDVTAASVANVRVGYDDQAAGNIVIKETKAGALSGNITLTVSTKDVALSGKPVVTVTEGDATVDVTFTSGVATLTITRKSRVASTITVSGIELDVERFAADGQIEVAVAGPALVNFTAVDAETYAFALPAASIKVANARIGAAGQTVFTIGATSYTVDGRTMTMDVSPVIKDGRTLLPLRFAAEAAGVDAEEIIWDSVRKTVTLIRGDRVVQVQIGSTTMLINGAAVTMDIAPEIIDNRTMLPIRWIGMALRANVEWNATARTVTVAPY